MAEISPLRRRMIEDMTVRNLSPATQQSYLNAVSKFSRYFGRSPDRLGLEDVHAFQLHLVATGISWPALNQIVCARRIRPIVSTVSIPPHRSLESERAAHQANLQGVNFGRRSPDSGGQNCTPNDRHERA
jgi:integrase-like protein